MNSQHVRSYDIRNLSLAQHAINIHRAIIQIFLNIDISVDQANLIQ